jgi:hypothetical protein
MHFQAIKLMEPSFIKKVNYFFMDVHIPGRIWKKVSTAIWFTACGLRNQGIAI